MLIPAVEITFSSSLLSHALSSRTRASSSPAKIMSSLSSERQDHHNNRCLEQSVDNVGCVLQNVLLAAAFGPTFQYWDDLSLLTFDSNLFRYFLTKLAFAIKLFGFSHHTPLSPNSLSSFFQNQFSLLTKWSGFFL